MLLTSFEFLLGNTILIFFSIIFFDLNNGPINSNNFPPTTEEVLGPNNLNIEKKLLRK